MLLCGLIKSPFEESKSKKKKWCCNKASQILFKVRRECSSVQTQKCSQPQPEEVNSKSPRVINYDLPFSWTEKVFFPPSIWVLLQVCADVTQVACQPEVEVVCNNTVDVFIIIKIIHIISIIFLLQLNWDRVQKWLIRIVSGVGAT